MDRVFEATLASVILGGVALAKLDVLDDALVWLLKDNEPRHHMSSSNPWAKHDDPAAAKKAAVHQALFVIPAKAGIQSANSRLK